MKRRMRRSTEGREELSRLAWTGALAALGVGTVALLVRGVRALRGPARTGGDQDEPMTRRRRLLRAVEPFVERSSEAVAVLDAGRVVTYVNPAVRRLLGYHSREMIGRDALSFVHPDDVSDAARTLDEAMSAPGRSSGVAVRVRHQDGSWRSFEAVGTNLLDHPEVRGVVVNARDVTEQRRAERESELLRELTGAITGAATVETALEKTLGLLCAASGWECGEAWLLDGEGALERVAAYVCGDDRAERFIAAGERMRHAPADSIPGRVLASGRVAQVRDLTMVKQFRRQALARELGIVAAVGVPIAADGRPVGVLTFFSLALRDSDESSVGLAVAAAAQLGGLAERKRVEERLRENEAQYRRLFEHAPDGAILQEGGRITVANPLAASLLGYASPDQMVGRDAMTLVHPDSRPRAAERNARLEAGETNPLECLKLLRADGGVVHADVASTPVVARGHAMVYVTIRDASARVRAERELRESEERFRLAVRATHDVVWDWDPATDALMVSDTLGATFGHRVPGGRTSRAWWSSMVHPDDAARVMDSLRRAREGREEEWWAEYRFRRADGRYAVVLDRGYVVRDGAGRATRLVGAVADLSARRSLEEQLRHSQKMETLGQLAGGVAHDFNNVLTAISMHGEMLLEAIPHGDPVRTDAEEIRRAAERATSLTRQLLIFGRRQAARIEPLDLNEVVAGVQRMLARLLGAQIELVTRPGEALPPVLADRGQIEQVLLNLAINARDAMPDGGVIVIETGDVTLDEEHARLHPGASPGRHVVLAVTDTGHGMDDATRERAFEPFFTTKPEGKGTGLGLSIVAGIVRERGGHVYVYSEPGRGTSFKIYFPAAAGAREASAPRPPAAARRGAETILLVEDDETIRTAACRLLERHGYRVVEARSAGEAVRAMSGAARAADLMITDLTVGDESGVSLARRLRALRPEARVLFMSGYGEGAVSHLGLVGGAPFIEKPFTAEDLERKVQEALD